MRARSIIASILLLSGAVFGQYSSSSICSSAGLDCIRPADAAIAPAVLWIESAKAASTPLVSHAPSSNTAPSATAFSEPEKNATSETKPEGFHWRRALEESGTFLVVEQAWVVHTDFRWVVSENGIPFNHYWRDYKQSLTRWWEAGWSAGENPMYNYVGHPIQGAITGYIEIQNDPKSRNLEFGKTKAYWWEPG